MKIQSFLLALVLLCGSGVSALARPTRAAQPAAPPCAPAGRTGATPFDLDARERQVASGEQRIAPLRPEEFTKEV